MAKTLFTSESVTVGHPDKICDQLSDAVLDAMLEHDPLSRVACECTVTTGLVLVMGEITTECYVDIPSLVRKTICDIGYNRAKFGFDGSTCGIIMALDSQSEDIALGVNESLEHKSGIENDELDIGAGDQGMMFGYACDETDELMPLPISLAHALTRKLTALRQDSILNYLRPDGKAQVTVAYENGVPTHVDTVVVSTQHDEHVTQAQLHDDIAKLVVKAVIPSELLTDSTRILVNPTGRFVIGGPKGDSGLTGRKIIVDTYGGYARHGGGCFSGKDPTKVDRSAAYMARYIAKNIVAAKLAKRCEIQLAYAIGVANPVSVLVDTQGTGAYCDEKIADAVQKVFDLRPAAIIKALDLRRPIYLETAKNGHFGNPSFSWEKTDKIAELLAALND
ncbi:MAG: methionine adenosyltransferase [Eubacteriales bacterium]|nr:methionine adenosyltransferase [Eubacteriales bacterium]